MESFTGAAGVLERRIAAGSPGTKSKSTVSGPTRPAIASTVAVSTVVSVRVLVASPLSDPVSTRDLARSASSPAVTRKSTGTAGIATPSASRTMALRVTGLAPSAVLWVLLALRIRVAP